MFVFGGSVMPSATAELTTIGMPDFSSSGTEARVAFEQAPPMIANTFWSYASFLTAAMAPSGLQSLAAPAVSPDDGVRIRLTVPPPGAALVLTPDAPPW